MNSRRAATGSLQALQRRQDVLLTQIPVGELDEIVAELQIDSSPVTEFITDKIIDGREVGDRTGLVLVGPCDWM